MPTVQQSTLDLISTFEGVRYSPYKDSVGLDTTGVGHLILDPKVKPQAETLGSKRLITDTLTSDEVLKLFKFDVQDKANITPYITATLTQNQFDALTSLTFNIGIGAFRKSDIRKIVNANSGNFDAVEQEIRQAFRNWTTAKKIFLPGLATRRTAEANLFFDPSTDPNTAKNTAKAAQKSGSKVPNNQKNLKTDTQEATGEEPKPSEPVKDFQPLFDQIQRNLENLEAGDTEVGWGKRSNPSEDSDWIGLRQFLLYLGTKFAPQSVFPFVELIPVFSLDTSRETSNKQAVQAAKNLGYIRDGEAIPDEIQIAKDVKAGKKGALETQNFLKFVSILPPGFNEERFIKNAQTINDASGSTDLFNLDPFGEGIKFVDANGLQDHLSEGGQAVLTQRLVGVRVFGQLVLNPAPIPGVSSKPGAIGFTELEIKAGSQSDNGLAMITMKLLDVQGNKFTDLNSPWAFIFDARPGSIAGDFYFRYGWQIRIPRHGDKDDMMSDKFWNHPGWNIFPSDTKETVKNKLKDPGNPVITLTQDRSLESIFEVQPLNADQQFVINRRTLSESKYVRISIINPELEIDDKGAATANLTFMTTNALSAAMCPLERAENVKALISRSTKVSLADLMIALIADNRLFSILPIDNPELKEKQRNQLLGVKLDTSIELRKKEGLKSLIRVISPDRGGNRDDGIDPRALVLDVKSKFVKELTTAKKDSNKTLIRWFRQLLQENQCELMSAAGGSGAGINASYIVSTTQKISKKDERIFIEKLDKLIDQADPVKNELAISELADFDVFAHRFSGSLAEKINIKKTDAPNALKLEVDYNVGDAATFESDTSKNDTQSKETFTKVSALDRKRNLLTIFSQMQNCEIECIAHPWLAPGSSIFIKGLGFYDGEYMCLQVTHKLDGHKFTSQIEGARILLTSEEDDTTEAKDNSIANGKKNMASPVTKQFTGFGDSSFGGAGASGTF